MARGRSVVSRRSLFERLATGTALGGSLAGLLPLAAYAQTADPVQLAAGPLTVCCYSADGQNGSDGVYHWEPWESNDPATNGTDAGSISVENTSAVALTSQGTASGATFSTLAITATGGNGGSGDTDESSMANANGGNGGSAQFTNSGTITLGEGASFSIPVPQPNDPNNPGSATTVVVTPVIGVSAWGGVGGSYPYWVAEPSKNGLGGNGGTATFNMTGGSITALQSTSASDSFSYYSFANRLVVVDASSGQATYAASGEGVAATIVGGNGGTATTTITSGTLKLTRPDVASGSTTSDGSIATSGTTSGFVLVTQAHGGWQATNGGNGGTVSVTTGTGSGSATETASTDAVVIAAEGNGIAGIYAGANGGDGTNSWDLEDTPGNGGTLGFVTVELKASTTVTTSGNDAPALIAEAVGGWGGGSDNIAGGAGGAATDTVENPSVSVTNKGQITTTGDRSIAIVAQSIGGVGGDATSQNDDAYNGGDGGSSGFVSVSNSGSISTAGLYAFGIYALSAGGAGGSGSITDAFFSGQGGGGGNGGDANLVGIVNATAAQITTLGDYAVGIIAQSVGGGSATSLFGSGDFAPAISQPGSSSEAGGSASGLFSATGGTGGAGGTGGSVQVINSGSVSTSGGQAFGILAQSIGGNGGDGGNSSSVGAFHAISLGGGGGSGGNAGSVTVSNVTDEDGTSPASISTTGVSATGIFAQSIGGNGGAGGSADALSGGLLISISVAIGGSGAGGGDAGEVSVDNSGSITTENSDAPAILAQAIGGGGGRGGQASATAVAVGFKAGDVTIPAISLTTAVGGSGGGGGTGGVVKVDNEEGGSIVTHGVGSAGIKALSVGGGGGDGGNSVTASDMLGTSLNVGVSASLGGSGDGGGAGGDVTVSNEGSITTYGTLSNAITAASVGGGGGDGGTGTSAAQVGITALGSGNTVLTTAIPMGDSITATFDMGGSGAGGGDGGDVTVTNSSIINVHGSSSVGIFAQSVGGGGGMGGGYSGGGTGTLSLSAHVGGQGGTASSGGTVTVTNDTGASITTDAEASHGIQAQSVGGGGGAGGSMTTQTTGDDSSTWATVKKVFKEVAKYYSFTDQKVKDDINSKAATLASSTVSYLKSLFGSGSAATTEEAEGIFADLKNAGSALFSNLKTARDNLDAQAKQSKLPVNAGLTVTFGGRGGGGGDGGEVDVTNHGSITTKQESSFAIFAQSVGGGGGSGGAGYSSGTNSVNLTLSVGASGGDGGAGGEVTVKNTGTLTTHGASSLGLLAQSVGGGGGVGGAAQNSQSISFSGNINLGGNGGTSSPGGAVSVTNSGSITTSGEEAHALVAQSVGGGGGMFVINQADTTQATSISSDDNLNAALQVMAAVLDGIGATPVSGLDQTDVLPSPAIGLTLGGAGSGGGDGGAVNVTQSGSIKTTGNNAFGIFAQSIGGGGGFGSDGEGASLQSLDLTLGAGGDGGPGGSGGSVTLTFDGTSKISTSGTGSTAVFLQSVGGGGGYSGSFTSPSVAGNLGEPDSSSTLTSFIAEAAASGSGGAILVEMGQTSGSTMSITTSGKNAHGIYAQSIGGSGGVAADENGLIVPITSSQSASTDASRVAPDGGTGGTITMDLVGSVQATGENSIALYAQSGFLDQNGQAQANVAGGAISLDLTGTFTGGSGTGAAIVLDGGAYGDSQNSITVEKTSTVSAKSGTAILASFGQEAVTNYGTVIGDINLASGGTAELNAFDNMVGATYRTAGTGTVNLGSGGLFTNAGTFDIGGVGSIATASLTGAFTQKSTGQLLVDVDSSAAAGKQNDVLTVAGGATLGGQMTVNVMNSLLPGRYTIINATGGVQGTASATTTTAEAAGAASAITWTVSVNGDTATLTPHGNFSGTGATLTKSEAALAQHLQNSWASGGAGMGSTFAAISAIGSTSAYESQLDSLSAEENNTPASTQTIAARTSMNASLSCPVFTGSSTLLQETSCVWARVTGASAEQYSTSQINGYTVNALTYRVGAQKEIYSDWFLGMTAGFTTSSVSPANGWSDTDGQAGDASVSLKRQIGPWLLSVTGHLGFGGFDNARTVQIGSNTYRTQSNSEVFTAGGRFRAAYEFAFADWYLKPYADFDAIYTYMPGYSENPVAGMNLIFGDMKEWTFAFSPNLEMGARFNVTPDAWLRPYASVGATFLNNDGLDMETRLQGIAVNVPTYTTTVELPDTLFDVGAGLQLYYVQGLELRADYKAQIGDNFLGQELSARVSVPF